jgi:hypothetical protein
MSAAPARGSSPTVREGLRQRAIAPSLTVWLLPRARALAPVRCRDIACQEATICGRAPAGARYRSVRMLIDTA